MVVNARLIIIQDPDYRGKGTSDGVFQYHTYFNCHTDCGLFVSLEKLWFEPKPVGMQDELQLASKQQSVNKRSSFTVVTSPPFHGHKKPLPPTSLGSSDVDPPMVRFKIDDQVVVFDKHDTPLHGSVRWIGRKNQLGRDMGELHIGIEMVIIYKLVLWILVVFVHAQGMMSGCFSSFFLPL